jgi:hypothetical protein
MDGVCRLLIKSIEHIEQSSMAGEYHASTSVLPLIIDAKIISLGFSYYWNGSSRTNMTFLPAVSITALSN